MEKSKIDGLSGWQTPTGYIPKKLVSLISPPKPKLKDGMSLINQAQACFFLPWHYISIFHQVFIVTPINYENDSYHLIDDTCHKGW